MKTLEEKMENSRTSIVRIVSPSTTNHYGTLFGGTTLKWMDEVALISATRFGRKKFVTVSSDKVDFKIPIPEGHFVELIGKVSKVGNTSLVVEVKLFLEEMYSERRVLAVEGTLTFVAVDNNRKPIRILD